MTRDYPDFQRPLSDFATAAEWLIAAEEHYSHQFDVDPIEFEEVWGIPVEHAAKHNDSWTGQEGFHACSSQPCIDSLDALFGGTKGKVCWCDCHKWNRQTNAA